MLALFHIETSRTLDRQVVRFGGTGRPYDFLGVGAEEIGYIVTRLLDQLIGLPTKRV